MDDPDEVLLEDPESEELEPGKAAACSDAWRVRSNAVCIACAALMLTSTAGTKPCCWST